MPASTLSSTFQVAIPPEGREASSLVPGQKLERVIHDGRIPLVPASPMARFAGITHGTDSELPRDDDRV